MFSNLGPNSMFRPMLAVKADLTTIKFPVLASTKFDGIGCIGINGVAKTKSMKNIPNRCIQAWFLAQQPDLNGLDGELIIGSPTAPDCYNKTVSGVMTVSGYPQVTFYVFDRWDTNLTYTDRLAILQRVSLPGVVIISQVRIDNIRQLRQFEDSVLDQGYEGVVLRDP